MKKNVALIFRIVLILIGLYGLYLNFFSSNSNAFELLHYFTILSNILVVGLFIFLIIKHNNKCYPRLKGAVTMSITVTFLIFHFILRPSIFNMANTNYDLYSFSNISMHYIIPLMTIFDWILFDTKGKYTVFDPLIWLIIPFVYFVIMSINGLLGYTFTNGSHFPYFFMDYYELGILKVSEYVVLIIVFFTVLGYIYYGIDKLLGRKK